MAAALIGLLLGLGFCAFAWWSGEHAERRMRIERARRRNHARVPLMRWVES
ncbi:hypothetical protein [Variovorax boronicumulans]|uniref:hypothetical protein n=1 Tax=Variovorax boronicumulans TaxID=436515 RepID=UPI00142E6AA0|nr:hypothetical protein [Variovorax boronicumulans]